jgi:hypothetical protein
MTGVLPQRIRKIRLCSCILHLISFLFSLQIPAVFPLSSRMIFGAATTFLLPHFKGSSWLYERKEKSRTFL